ncbi:LemA family protein [Lewinella sp. LCG006]|uniref:LemA family protein n=1 Tax=Lewinella sp. LCG006 TaxID=3231911 RepID=UPI003460CDE3
MKSITTIGVVLVLLLLLFMGGCSSYNGFVDSEENVDQAWANVQTQYQRRTDLITNLVNTVKGAANFERETLEAVVNARAKATSVNIDPSNLTAEKLQEFQAAQSQLGQSLGRLLVTVEKYPELQANANFRDLQTQLEGTENRVAVARQNFNEVVTGYNKQVRRFPGSFFASIFGFSEKAQFEAQAGSENAPTVNFD